MFRSPTQNFDPYNFFSVLLPGVSTVLALVPFYPSGTRFHPILTVIPLLAGGFVVGQVVHSLATWWQAETTNRTHREQFQELLKDDCLEKYQHSDHQGRSADARRAEIVSDGVLETFYRRCDETFDSISLEPFAERDGNQEQHLTDLYRHVRGTVHIDASGRSRTFHAVYAFCRSMWIASVILWSVYAVYAFFRVLHVDYGITTPILFQRDEVGAVYEPILSQTVGNPALVFLLATVVFLGGHKVFRLATDEYKDSFTQYLLTDFLLLSEPGNADVGQQPDAESCDE